MRIPWYRATRRAAPPSKRTFAGCTRYARVISVYDGDTITVATRLHRSEPFCRYSVRLAGVDTPEVRTADALHKDAGLAVRDRLRALLPSGTVIIVDFDSEDKYGRLLGTAHTVVGGWVRGRRRGTNVSRWLLDHGFALPYDGGTKGEFTREMLQGIVTTAGG
jgi:endonuclease YncB( thermonuclease family)